VQKLATLTHSFYTICRVVDKENISLSRARLALVDASRIVLATPWASRRIRAGKNVKRGLIMVETSMLDIATT
jgi:hypothetical protein